MHPILEDRRRFQLHLIACALVGLTLTWLIHELLQVRWADALVFGLPLGLAAAPFSLSAWYICRAQPLSRTSGPRATATALVAALISGALWAAVGRGYWHLLIELGRELPDVSVPRIVTLMIGVGALAYLLSIAVHYVVQAFEASADASRRMLESQVAQRDAELRALRAQIDPHFLFNCLNSISGLIVPAPDKARQMCQLLGDFLRDCLALGAVGRISLGREVALAEQYLRVEQVRFGARLTLQVSVTDDAEAAPAPPLILQPLVENAVRHGIGTCVDGGVIDVSARRVGQTSVVTVTNPRDRDGGRRGTGLGLENVRRRLAATFGDRAAINVEPSEDRYRVVVTMPIETTTVESTREARHP